MIRLIFLTLLSSFTRRFRFPLWGAGVRGRGIEAIQDYSEPSISLAKGEIGQIPI
jgi:hypothetical protein